MDAARERLLVANEKRLSTLRGACISYLTRYAVGPKHGPIVSRNLLYRVGLFARRRLKGEHIALFLTHQGGAQGRDVGELLHAHIGLLATDNRVLMRIVTPLLLNGDIGVEADLALLLAVSNNLRVLHELLQFLDAFLGCRLQIARLLVFGILGEVAE